MDIKNWLQMRSPAFIVRRSGALIRRYGLDSSRAEHRLERLMEMFARFNCAPTFPVPGAVVEKHAAFIRSLQSAGAEIAVHSYNHINLAALLPHQAVNQLLRAKEVFEHANLPVHGFRCPYLSCTDGLISALPENVFEYSSNHAVHWPLASSSAAEVDGVLYATIARFYVPEPATRRLCLPYPRGSVIEIPVSVPDDLQLRDGLGYSGAELSRAWVDILARTHRQGEIFNLMFHPELGDDCMLPFSVLLNAAAGMHPAVWVARLQDVSAWWVEKKSLEIDLKTGRSGYLDLELPANPRATWLVRGLNLAASEPWVAPYNRLTADLYEVPAVPRPLVGIHAGDRRDLLAALQNQGYILDVGETAPSCSVYLNEKTLAALPEERDVVESIERTPGPLIRLWPWPNGVRSTLCITGDLDALSLVDYAARLTHA